MKIYLSLLLMTGLVVSLPADESENPILPADQVKRQAPPPTDPWSDCPVGTWIKQKEMIIADGKTLQSEMFVLKKTSENKRGSYVGKARESKASKIRGRLVQAKKIEAMSVEEVGRREVTLEIDGSNFDCEKVTFKSKSTTIDIWLCADLNLPVRVMPLPGDDLLMMPHMIKVEFVGKRNGNTSRVFWGLSQFNVPVQVGSLRLSSMLGKLTTKTNGKGEESHEGRQSIWMSHQVPGGVLKMEGTGSQDGREFTVRTEVIRWDWPGQVLKTEESATE